MQPPPPYPATISTRPECSAAITTRTCDIDPHASCGKDHCIPGVHVFIELHSNICILVLVVVQLYRASSLLPFLYLESIPHISVYAVCALEPQSFALIGHIMKKKGQTNDSAHAYPVMPLTFRHYLPVCSPSSFVSRRVFFSGRPLILSQDGQGLTTKAWEIS